MLKYIYLQNLTKNETFIACSSSLRQWKKKQKWLNGEANQKSKTMKK